MKFDLAEMSRAMMIHTAFMAPILSAGGAWVGYIGLESDNYFAMAFSAVLIVPSVCASTANAISLTRLNDILRSKLLENRLNKQ